MRGHIAEQAAVPKHMEILPELPKTAVGKVFKPDLRRRAIARVYDAALGARPARRRSVVEVVEDRKRGPGRGAGAGAGRAATTRRSGRCSAAS